MTNFYFKQLAKRHESIASTPISFNWTYTNLNSDPEWEVGGPQALPLPWPFHGFPDQNIRCFQFILTLKLGFMVMVSEFLINCSKTMFTHIDHNIDLPDQCLGLPGQYVGLPGRCHGQSSFESLTDRRRYLFALPPSLI